MKIKASELTGAALNWAAAKADNNLHPKGDVRLLDRNVFIITAGDYENPDLWQRYAPAIYWAQGGPIIESNEIELKSIEDGVWQASNLFDDMEWHHFVGYSPLEAAMRCHVAHRLGEEVEIPKELYED